MSVYFSNHGRAIPGLKVTNKKLVVRRKSRKFKRKIAVSQLPKQVRPEIRKRDMPYINAAAAGTATANYYVNGNFFDITKGDNIDNRQGNRIFAKFVTLKGQVHFSATQADTICRVVLLIDNEPSTNSLASPPNWVDVFQTTAGTANSQLLAPLNSTYTGRFRIVKSWSWSRSPHIFDIDSSAGVLSAATSAIAPVMFSARVRINRILQFVSGAPNDVAHGCKLYMFAWSNNDANKPQITATARTYYTDA